MAKVDSKVIATLRAYQEKNRKPIGATWEVVQEFKGNSHKNGGINLEVGDGYVRRIDGTEEADDIAKKGVVIKRNTRLRLMAKPDHSEQRAIRFPLVHRRAIIIVLEVVA